MCFIDRKTADDVELVVDYTTCVFLKSVDGLVIWNVVVVVDGLV